jgi:DNA-binding response OmpR family regulator
MKILLVEDEIEMQKYHHLELEKNIVEIANDFNSAYEKYKYMNMIVFY